MPIKRTQHERREQQAGFHQACVGEEFEHAARLPGRSPGGGPRRRHCPKADSSKPCGGHPSGLPYLRRTPAIGWENASLSQRGGEELGAAMRDNNAVPRFTEHRTLPALFWISWWTAPNGFRRRRFPGRLTRLAAEELSGPEHEVSCGITVTRRKQPPRTWAAPEEGSVSRPPDSAGARRRELRRREPLRAAWDEGFTPESFAEARRFTAKPPGLAPGAADLQLKEFRHDLATAMQSRTIIDMAIGAIMAQNRCGRDAAFKILRNTSNNRNMKIRDVAASVRGLDRRRYRLHGTLRGVKAPSVT